MMQTLISNFAQNRIHHDKKANGCSGISIQDISSLVVRESLTYRNRHANELPFLQRRSGIGHKVP